MEIPTEIRNKYRHWEYHTRYKPKAAGPKGINAEILKQIINFSSERMRIWEKKANSKETPYTKDGILQKFRFCNVYRELDRQTLEIHGILNEIIDNFKLWLLNLSFNRFLCSPETFKKVGFLNFDQKNNHKVMENLLTLNSPKYGSAYVFPISAIQRSEWNTREKFFCLYLPMVISRITEAIESFKDLGVSEALPLVLKNFGYNFKFHWTEILIDVSYQHPDKINLFKQFPLGPGSLPTIQRLSRGNPEKTLLQLINLKLDQFPYLEYEGKKVWLSAENWEGIGCEFRKYTNLKNGRGRKRLINSVFY